MNRHALLIGNLDAVGAQNDINNWRKFLRSGVGGAWNQNEIEILTNPTKVSLELRLYLIKASAYDFVFVVYAGHGGWERSTILEINPQCETISETQLKGLASREILTLDCCRGTSTTADVLNEAQLRMFSETTRSTIRARYDARMMAASPQQVTLYACSIGESAYCTSDGGYYTRNLIRQSAAVPTNGYRTVNLAHSAASPATTQEVATKENKDQHPDIAAVRCLYNQQLIVGIDTSSFRIY